MAGVLNTNITTTSGFPNASAAIYYDKRLLTRLEKELHFDQFGQKKTLPKGSGRTITFTRYTNFAANTTPLNEGESPDGLTLQSTQIPCIPLQYGDYVTLSDYLIGESIDPVIEGALDVLQYRAALSIDTIIRNSLDGNVTKQFANKVANEAAVIAVMTSSEIRRAVYTLRNVAAKRIGSSYPCVISPAQSFDLQGENATGAWLDMNKYTTPGPLYKGEIGSMYGSRLVESPNVYIHVAAGGGSPAADVHQAYMFAQEAYGLVELAGNNLKTIIKQLGSAGSADPLDQRSTVGYKFSHVTKVLDVLRAIEIYTATAAY
jgi:N4-gp56 family major capsid protein